MNWLRRSFYGLLAIAVLQTLYYYPQMPAVVASHFDGLGAPNGWSSRNGFFALYLGITTLSLGLVALLLALDLGSENGWSSWPVVVLFGSTCPQEIELYGRGEKIVTPISCHPCYLHECDISPSCQDLITPDEVYAAVQRTLSSTKSRSGLGE